jgi:pantoate--beta-alanine ligase
MGYLHEGHLSLVRVARARNDAVVVSVFVNPTQFGPSEDFSTYPRDFERDTEVLAECEVDCVFAPSSGEMYRFDASTSIQVAGVSEGNEGDSRPGHFAGVATVVAKLFNIVQPQRAYFGQKDAQQLAVIRRLVRDLDFPIEIIACPTVREPDGLAMSSRNVYLPPDERKAATVLYRALQACLAAFRGGETSAASLRAAMSEVISREPLARPDYVSVADPESMTELEIARQGALASLAVRMGKTRLIDNILLTSA